MNNKYMINLSLNSVSWIMNTSNFGFGRNVDFETGSALW